ncbi:MAG: GxxExxY protein [Balneolales bacterium]|nr:GxxExxY protein [Balneolales bacterium]
MSNQREIIYKQLMDSCYRVHSNLGPGLLESSYKECLFYELNKSGLWVEKEKPIPLVYEDVQLEAGYRVDLLVEHQIIVEIKSVEAVNDTHRAQILTYLKLSGCELGMLVNFNVAHLKNGMQRLILTQRR